jgi:tRNA:m4X modification enzyme
MFCLNEQEMDRDRDRDRDRGREDDPNTDPDWEHGNKDRSEADESEKRTEYESMSYAERVDLGRKCKRLMDYGRVEYIRRELKMNATLVHYTEEDVTPENVLLIAWRDR